MNLPPQATAAPEQAAKQPRRRNRVPQLCTTCRLRKVKCDRGHPCDMCIKYNIAASCTYHDPNWLANKKQQTADVTRNYEVYRELAVLPIGAVPPPPIASPAQPPNVTTAFGQFRAYMRKPHEQEVLILPVPPTQLTLELEVLKDRIRMIETLMGASSQNAAVDAWGGAPPGTNPPPAPLPPQQPQVQLPPLQHWPPAAGTPNGYTYTQVDPRAYLPPRAGSPPDVVVFHSGYLCIHVTQARLTNHGPLLYRLIIQKDRFLVHLWGMVHEAKRVRKSWPYGGVKRILPPENEKGRKCHKDQANEWRFRRRLYEQEGIFDVQLFNAESPSGKPDDKQDGNRPVAEGMPHLRLSSSNKGALKQDVCSADDELTERIHKALPTQKATWLLVERFFRYVYPVFPLMDEVYFSSICFETVLGPRQMVDEPFPKVTVSKKLEYANLGLLMMVLRLALLTLYSNLDLPVHPDEDPEWEYLRKHTVSDEAVDVAHRCLDQFAILRKLLLFIFRLAMLIRIHNFYSPEDSDGVDGSDLSVFTGMIAQMGTAIGLNRDPLEFDQLTEDPKLVNIWRKLWHFLVGLDLKKGFMLGTKLLIDPELYDTRLPLSDERSCNIQDMEVELVVVRHFYQCDSQVYPRVLRLLRMVLMLRERPRTVDVESALADIEQFLADTYGLLAKIATPYNHSRTDALQKVYDLTTYVYCRTFCLLVYLHLQYHYEGTSGSRESVAFTYFRKSMLVATEIGQECLKLVVDPLAVVGPGWDMVVTPMLFFGMHKMLPIMYLAMIRSQFWIDNAKIQFKITPMVFEAADPGNPLPVATTKGVLEELITTLSKSRDVQNKVFLQLSKRYFYLWRLHRAHSLIFQVIKDEFLLPLPTLNGNSPVMVKDMNKFNVIRHATVHQLKEILAIARQKVPMDRLNQSYPLFVEALSMLATLLDSGSVAEGTTPVAGTGEVKKEFVVLNDMEELWALIMSNENDYLMLLDNIFNDDVYTAF